MDGNSQPLLPATHTLPRYLVGRNLSKRVLCIDGTAETSAINLINQRNDDDMKRFVNLWQCCRFTAPTHPLLIYNPLMGKGTSPPASRRTWSGFVDHTRKCKNFRFVSPPLLCSSWKCIQTLSWGRSTWPCSHLPPIYLRVVVQIVLFR